MTFVFAQIWPQICDTKRPKITRVVARRPLLWLPGAPQIFDEMCSKISSQRPVLFHLGPTEIRKTLQNCSKTGVVPWPTKTLRNDAQISREYALVKETKKLKFNPAMFSLRPPAKGKLRITDKGLSSYKRNLHEPLQNAIPAPYDEPQKKHLA